MKKQIQLAVGIVVSAIFIWLAFWLGGVTLEEIVSALRTTSWVYAIPFVVLTLISFYWRTIRWRILLSSVKDISSYRLMNPLMIGFAFNNIFPARAGEFARPYALLKTDKVPYGAGLSTVFLERVIDLATLLVLLLLMPLYLTLDKSVVLDFQGIDVSAAWLNSNLPKISITALVLLAGIGSLLIRPIKDFYQRLIFLVPLVPIGIKTKLAGFVESFATGARILTNPMALIFIAVHSAIIWLSCAYTFVIMSWGFPGVELTFAAAVGFMLITALSAFLPATPGYWGTFEFGGMFALVLMGVVTNTPEGRSAAFTFTLVVHFLQWLPLTVWGLIAAGMLHVSPSVVEEKTPSESMQQPMLQRPSNE